MKTVIIFVCFIFLYHTKIIKPGIDGDISVLYGEKVGLLTNPTGVNYELDSSIDILFKHPRIQLTSLFGPEHGIRGDIPPGQRFEDYVDPITKLPVYSLYARNVTSPLPYMLRNVTALVFDIQDVGARCYTYISSMVRCLIAAKNNNVKKFVILDRPNPLGGDMQGNTLELNFTSFIGIWKIPMKHGMTMGELALLFNKEMGINHPGLHIVRIENYDRQPISKYQNYGWILPSPNIPNFETSLLYPGTVLFESAWNVSLGRGTTTPFAVFGAPYIDPYKILARVQYYQKQPDYEKYFTGIKIIPYYFTPTTSYHKDRQCSGIVIIITNRDLIKNPIGLSFTLYKSFMDVYESRMDIRISYFNTLLGTDKIFKMIKLPVPEIEKTYHKDIEEFRLRRREFLLYPE